MPLEFQPRKPQPLMLGDKAHYTLSSYDPVSVEVTVLQTTDEDIDLALDTLLENAGATRDDLADPVWFAEHFEGVPDEATMREEVRAELNVMNARFAEERKAGLAIAELIKRLEQSIPLMHLARYRQAVQMSFEQQMAAEGMTLNDFLANSGASRNDLDAMFDQQAQYTAEQDAALDAYAREKKLSVAVDEIGQLLGIPADQLDEVIAQTRASGQYDQLHDAALHAKAARSVVAECNCTYHHETEAEARVRIAQAKQLREQYDRGFGGNDAEESGSGFTLV